MVQEHRIRKHYTAFITRDPSLPETGTMTDYLFFDKRADKSFIASPTKTSAKKAELTYTLTDCTDMDGIPVTRAEIDMITGRTHQIRVQFASRHSPLIGDRKYGSRVNYKSPALFCTELEFEWKGEAVHLQLSEEIRENR
jgi:23S rRNA pseudouridine1911/1915/1917 synthase